MDRLSRKTRRTRDKRGPYNLHEFKDSSRSIPKSTFHALTAPPASKRFRGPDTSKNGRKRKLVRSDEGCGSCDISNVSKEQDHNVREQDTRLQKIVAETEGEGGVIPEGLEGLDQEVTVDGFVRVEEEAGEEERDGEEGPVGENKDEEECFLHLLNEGRVEDVSVSPIPDDPVPSDGSDSESEDEATSSDVFLSTKNKIHLLLLLGTKRRYNLSYTATEAVMQLAGVLADEVTFSPSRRLMKKVIQSYSASLSEHHLCAHCSLYIGPIEESATCGGCGQHVDAFTNKKKGNFFLYLSIEDQLRALLETGLYHKIINPHDRSKINIYNYEDIFDGAFYKDHVKDSLSFNFFVDGLQVASTSKFSAWPILLCINEFPLHLRRQHVLMASIWLGKSKPNINEYMKPFIEECIILEGNGLSFKCDGVMKTIRIKPLMCVSDSIARPLLRNSSQFNGKFGCGLCLHPGIRMRRGKGHARSYTIAEQEFPLRNHEETMAFARQAAISGKSVRGIKGFSILSRLPGFDVIRCLDLDLFHALVNCTKRFTSLWFLPKYSNKPFNISGSFSVVDDRLLSITPTNNVSRAPRSLKERSDYRGHEWFYFTVFYSLPILKGILGAKYLNHWALLVHGIALLMQNSLSKSELVYASRYLKQFNQQIDELYGPEHVTFSTHLLTHLERSVTDFGQPWTHSAFIFESVNGELKSAVKSSNGVGQQISKHMQLNLSLQRMRTDLECEMNSKEKDYLRKIMSSSKKLAEPDIVLESGAFLGQPKISCLDQNCCCTILRAGFECAEAREYSIYDRCCVNDIVFHSVNYTRSEKQNNSIVVLTSGQAFEIHSFVVIDQVGLALGHFLIRKERYNICNRALPHILVFAENCEETLRCVPVSHFEMKLLSFIVKLSDSETLRIGCINILEMEMLS